MGGQGSPLSGLHTLSPCSSPRCETPAPRVPPSPTVLLSSASLHPLQTRALGWPPVKSHGQPSHPRGLLSQHQAAACPVLQVPTGLAGGCWGRAGRRGTAGTQHCGWGCPVLSGLHRCGLGPTRVQGPLGLSTWGKLSPGWAFQQLHGSGFARRVFGLRGLLRGGGAKPGSPDLDYSDFP